MGKCAIEGLNEGSDRLVGHVMAAIYTKQSCVRRNKAGWLDSELNMFTHQYLQPSR